MPFRSESQRRKFYAMEDRGEISMDTVKKWEKKTPDKIPERVKQACLDELNKNANIMDIARGIGKRVKSFGSAYGSALSGRNVQEAAELAHGGVMKNPLIRKAVKKTPSSERLMSEQVGEMLYGRQQIPVEIFEMGGKRRDLVRALEKGQKAIGKARTRRRLARGGTALAVGTPIALGVGSMMSPDEAEKTGAKKKSLGEQAKELAPAVAAGAVGSVPILHGLKTQALKVKGDKGQVVTDPKQLKKLIRPGDVLLSADPGKAGKWKAQISMLGGDPTGYHVETVTGKSGPGLEFQRTHASPGWGGAMREGTAFVADEDVIIRRFKDKQQAKEYLKNVRARAKAEEAFGSVFGERARGRLYAGKQNISSALKSMLPGPLSKLIPDPSSVTGMASCSSLTGQCSPVSLAPGVSGKDVLPHHVRSSKAFDTIATYRAPQTGAQRVYNAVLRASPWLLRGAAAAGLGYGAYRGAKALAD